VDEAARGARSGSGERWLRIRSGYVVDRRRPDAAHVLERTKDQAASLAMWPKFWPGVGGLAGAEVTWADSVSTWATLRCDLPRRCDVRWGRLVGSEPLDWKATAFLGLPPRSPACEPIIRRVGRSAKAEGRPC